MNASKFRIKITQVGYLFIVLCLGVGVAALNTGNNLLYLIFSMMLSFLILSGILSNSTLLGLQFTPSIPKRVFALKAFNTRFEIFNRKKYLSSFCVNIVPLKENAVAKFALKIPPQKETIVPSQLMFEKRGWDKVPYFRLETFFPFGFLKKYIDTHIDSNILVYPALASIPPVILHDRSMDFGEYLERLKKSSGTPSGIRDFVQGDAYKSIHWKSSARFQKLRVKEFEDEEQQKLVIQLSLAPVKTSQGLYREKIISIAASICLQLDENKVPFSLGINKNIFFPISSTLDQKLSALALCKEPQKHFECPSLKSSTLLLSDALESKNLGVQTLIFEGPSKKESIQSEALST